MVKGVLEQLLGGNETVRIIEYHREHLETAVLELDLMIDPLEYELEMVDKAISVARLQIDKRQEAQQRHYEEKQQTRHREAITLLTKVERILAIATALLAAVTVLLIVVELFKFSRDEWETLAVVFFIAFAAVLVFRTRRKR